MTSLPRYGVLAKKNLRNYQNKYKNEVKKELNILDGIQKKYEMGPLTFRSVIFATPDGKITLTNHTDILGDLRHGILFIQSSGVSISNEVYDLYTLALNKRKRDIEKHLEAQKKTQIELDRLNKENQTENTQVETPIETPIETQVDNQTENKPIEIKRGITKKTGNKFFRGFMTDVRSKFKLEFQYQYKFAEFKADGTDMIIDNVDVYKVVLLENVCFMVIGDFQMKSSVIKQIDPTYEADVITDNNLDFMNNIENCNNMPELTEI